MLTTYRSSMIFAVIISLLFLLINVSGCSNKMKIPDVSLLNQPDRYPVDSKINLRVGLALDGLYDDFRTTKWGKKIPDESNRQVLGEQLAKNSAELACLLFNQVSAVKKSALEDKGRPDILLTPRIVAIQEAAPAIRGDELKVMLAMEWKLERLDRSIIWIDTVKGKAKAPADGDFKPENFNSTLLHDLFSKSFQVVRSSSVIRKYATQNRDVLVNAGRENNASGDAGNTAEKCSSDILSVFRDKAQTAVMSRNKD